MGALMIAFCPRFGEPDKRRLLGEKPGLARIVRHSLIIVDDCHAAGSVAAVEVSGAIFSSSSAILGVEILMRSSIAGYWRTGC